MRTNVHVQYTFYNVHTHACCYSTNFEMLLLLLLSCKTAVNVFIFAHSFPYHTVFSSEPYFFCRTKTTSRELTEENTKKREKIKWKKKNDTHIQNSPNITRSQPVSVTKHNRIICRSIALKRTVHFAFNALLKSESKC